MSAPTENSASATAVPPFTVPVTPEAELEALRARVAATRWPDRELVTDNSQGPKLAVMQELARYWAAEYDWRRCEAKLNALPQQAPPRCRPPRPDGPLDADAHHLASRWGGSVLLGLDPPGIW